jgi:hypothetical protein
MGPPGWQYRVWVDHSPIAKHLYLIRGNSAHWQAGECRPVRGGLEQGRSRSTQKDRLTISDTTQLIAFACLKSGNEDF